jgi:hypothetical protein
MEAMNGASHVQDIERDMEGDLKVCKIDTDDFPKLASKYRVQVDSFS